MVVLNPTLMTLVHAIVADDVAMASSLLAMSDMLARASAEHGATRQAAKEHFLTEIEHYMYAGDTALHIAAPGYRSEIARLLLSMGADVGARNRRGLSRFATRSMAFQPPVPGIRSLKPRPSLASSWPAPIRTPLIRAE